MRKRVALILTLFAALISTYFRTSMLSFVNFDDPVYVTANEHVKNGLTLAGVRWAFANVDVYWQPLAWLSQILDCELFGLDASAPHVVNAVFHATTAFLLFPLLHDLTGHKYRSIAVAALWALHPL